MDRRHSKAYHVHSVSIEGRWAHLTRHARKTYCMIVGDYGGPLGFATRTALLHSLSSYPFWIEMIPSRDDLPAMHIIILGLLLQMFYWFVNYLHEIALLREYACGTDAVGAYLSLGVYISLLTSVPEIEVPCGHSAPYCNPRSGVEAPFFTMGPFASTDTLFPGTPGDLDLYTDMEISGLEKVGLVDPSIART